MAKIENCSNCPIMKKIGRTLMKVYDYNEKMEGKEMTTFCGCMENSVMDKNDSPNVLCYMRHTYNTGSIDWEVVKQFYEEHKDAFGAVGIK